MDEESRPSEEPNLPRAHFHVALALFIPPGGILVGWTLAVLDVVKGYTTREQLAWTRLLVALVLVDALGMGALLWGSAHLEELQPKAPPDAKRSMIGVGFEDGRALKVREAPAGLPGARAGVEAGDVIEKIDDTAVTTPKELADAIQAKEAGTARRLTLKRGAAEHVVSVTPEPLPKSGERGLFEIEPAADLRFAEDVVVEQLPALALVLILAVWAKRRRSTPIPVWIGFLLALLGSMYGSLAFGALAKWRLGGSSLGLSLVSLLVQTVLLLLLTAAARKWLTRDLPPAVPELSPFRAGLQGLFYLVTGLPRLFLLLVVGAHFLSPNGPVADPMVAQLSEAHFGTLGGLLLILGVAVIGPLAEEALFRGYLLPRLVLEWGELPALASSSLLFALLHLRDGPITPAIFFYGWIFGWARLRSGGIGASTALHMAVNGVATAVILGQS